MRQAGRYLPEYRSLRAEAGSFLDLCLDPVRAAEIVATVAWALEHHEPPEAWTIPRELGEVLAAADE